MRVEIPQISAQDADPYMRSAIGADYASLVVVFASLSQQWIEARELPKLALQREAERVVDDLRKLEVDDSLCTGEAEHTLGVPVD